MGGNVPTPLLDVSHSFNIHNITERCKTLFTWDRAYATPMPHSSPPPPFPQHSPMPHSTHSQKKNKQTNTHKTAISFTDKTRTTKPSETSSVRMWVLTHPEHTAHILPSFRVWVCPNPCCLTWNVSLFKKDECVCVNPWHTNVRTTFSDDKMTGIKISKSWDKDSVTKVIFNPWFCRQGNNWSTLEGMTILAKTRIKSLQYSSVLHKSACAACHVKKHIIETMSLLLW